MPELIPVLKASLNRLQKKSVYDPQCLKAPFDLMPVTARLKAYPDTNRESFRTLLNENCWEFTSAGNSRADASSTCFKARGLVLRRNFAAAVLQPCEAASRLAPRPLGN